MRKQTGNIAKSVFVLGILLIFLTGCGAKQAVQYEEQEGVAPPKWPVSEYVRDDIEYMIDKYDPWEGFNRRMYVFNYYFDKYVFLPVVSGYAFITPNYVEDRITNFFKNLGELRNFTNNLLQLKAKGTGVTLGRFIINSTIGIAGLWDPATPIGLERHPEDFGQTLGHYNVGPGPYLVLPIFGPSTLRDTTGLVVDTAVKTAVYNEVLENADKDDEIKLALSLFEGIDTRHRISFRYYQSGSPFEYDFIRLLYLEKRKLEVAK
jgi:phospholipid-binding lipoprotein MlaA